MFTTLRSAWLSFPLTYRVKPDLVRSGSPGDPAVACQADPAQRASTEGGGAVTWPLMGGLVKVEGCFRREREESVWGTCFRFTLDQFKHGNITRRLPRHGRLPTEPPSVLKPLVGTEAHGHRPVCSTVL